MSEQPAPASRLAPPRSRVRYDEAWQNSLLRPILIAVLVVCLDVAVVNLLMLAITGMPPAYPRLILVAGITAALVGGYTTTILAQERNRLRRFLGFRLAEIGLILVILRLAIWVSLDTWPTLDTMMILPLETFFTGDFLGAALIVLFSWQFANLFTNDFNLMALQPDELLELAEEDPEGTSGGRRASVTTYLRGSRSDRAQYIDRMAIVQRFTMRWVFGAVLLMIMTAAARFGMPTTGFVGLTRQNIDPGVMGAAVVYLLVGLILISQGQLAALRARWALEDIRNVEGVLRRWPVYATLLILGMGLLAALMPFGGTFRLAQILNAIISLIQSILTTFMALIFLLLAFFIRPEEAAEEAAEMVPTLEIPPPLSGEPIIEALVPPWVGGAVFWIITGLLLGYATLIYLQGRGMNLAWLGVLWQQLRQAWHDLWQGLRSWQQTVTASLRTDRPSTPEGRTRRPSLLRRLLGQMSPAEQVQYYYLDTLDRAAERGIPRKQGETPSRYAPRLQASLVKDAPPPTSSQADAPESPQPDELGTAEIGQTADQTADQAADQAIDQAVGQIVDLTTAFEAAKYAARPVAEQDASRIKQIWETIKRRLQPRPGST